ncbi:MAG: hypothetical protein WBC90_13270 [Albidovulum sp.]
MDQAPTIKTARRWMSWFLIESNQLTHGLPWQRGNRLLISRNGANTTAARA